MPSWASIASGTPEKNPGASSSPAPEKNSVAAAGKALFKQAVTPATPSQGELRDLKSGLAKLWDLDYNCVSAMFLCSLCDIWMF